jgi:5-methylcytosine-specific restriction endonuclease McrA
MDILIFLTNQKSQNLMTARPVAAFTACGRPRGEFLSISAASGQTGISRDVITRILEGSYNVEADEYFWIDQHVYEELDAKRSHKRGLMYLQYKITPKLRKKGQLKRVFLSIADVSRETGLSTKEIRKIPQEGYLETDEFIWQTAEVIESIRDLIDSKYCNNSGNARDRGQGSSRANLDLVDDNSILQSVANERNSPLQDDTAMPILQYQIHPETRQKDKLMGKFSTIKEASEATGLSYGVISRCLKGKVFQRDDFIWERKSKSAPSSPLPDPPPSPSPVPSLKPGILPSPKVSPGSVESDRLNNQRPAVCIKKSPQPNTAIEDDIQIDDGHVKNQFLKILSCLQSKIRRYDSGVEGELGLEAYRIKLQEFQNLDVQLLDLTRHLDEAGDRSIKEVYQDLVSKIHQNDITRIVRDIEARLTPISPEFPKPSVKTAPPKRSPRRNPSKDFRLQLWHKYIGVKYGEIKCPLCQVIDIKQLDFVCGHVIAHVEGGELTLENIRPICHVCNGSMGKKGLNLSKYQVVLPRIGE